MPIPDFQSAMLPLLRLAGDGGEHRFRDAVEKLAAHFALTDEERNELLPSGTAPLFDNRVGWARTYLKQAGLLDSPKRGFFRISARGAGLLAQNPGRIDLELLDQFEEFRAFRSRRREASADEVGQVSVGVVDSQEQSPAQTPEDLLASAYSRLRKGLEQDLLDQAKASSSTFFERLVIDLLVAMGYGGSRQDAGRAIGRSGDRNKMGRVHFPARTGATGEKGPGSGPGSFFLKIGAARMMPPGKWGWG